jgi:hypothetical protein
MIRSRRLSALVLGGSASILLGGVCLADPPAPVAQQGAVAPAASDRPAPDKSGFTLLHPTPDADLRSFSTDRPPKANGPYTVDAGRFQYETDLFVYGQSNSGGVRTTAWTVLDPTLKLGLTNTVDFELQVTPYESEKTSGALGASSVSGAGDTYAKVKVNVLGDDNGDLALAIMPYVKLPTARSGLGNVDVEGGVVLPVGISAPGGFTVVVMPQFDDLKNTTGGGYHGAFDFLVNVSHPLDKKWTLYTEVFTTQSFQSHDRPIYTFDSALTYLLTPTIQLDFGSNISLNDVAPQTQVYTGISQRF